MFCGSSLTTIDNHREVFENLSELAFTCQPVIHLLRRMQSWMSNSETIETGGESNISFSPTLPSQREYTHWDELQLLDLLVSRGMICLSEQQKANRFPTFNQCRNEYRTKTIKLCCYKPHHLLDHYRIRPVFTMLISGLILSASQAFAWWLQFVRQVVEVAIAVNCLEQAWFLSWSTTFREASSANELSSVKKINDRVK